MTQLTLLVLAAGEGRRIKPVVTSKPLLPFMGKSLLERVVANCRELAFSRLAIVVNPKDKDVIQKLFPKAEIAVQDKPDGMAGAVLSTRFNLVGPTVIINGDDWIDEEIIKQFSKKIADQILLTGIKPRPGYTGGFFKLQGSTLKVIEKPGQPEEWARIVLDYFPKIEDFLAVLKDDYEAALNELDFSLLKATGEFYQLKFPWQILDLTAGLLKEGAAVHKTARVMAGSQVINSYLGPGVTVGQNCLIRDSIVESGSVVGFGTEIARSYVGPKNYFHRAYIGDSVIEGGSNFGAGSVTANFRFDHKPVGQSGREKFGAVVGKGAQVGVNASLMPGALIKSGELVWPGVVKQ